ncbi:unnamed protein product, partial [Pelagomonas calceolata]
WGRQLISSRTIGAPCALRKLQKMGEGTTGEWSRAPRGGRRRRRFGNGKGQRRGGGLGTWRPGRSAVLRRAAPQAALEVGRVPHGRIRADERVPAGAAALHEPRVVVHLARERLPHGLAPRRGRGARRCLEELGEHALGEAGAVRDHELARGRRVAAVVAEALDDAPELAREDLRRRARRVLGRGVVPRRARRRRRQRPRALARRA